jgi:DNA-binding LacI/PurR family transcriptional regulator
MVAAHAGVSRATVSRVVNGSSTVAPHLRDAVLRAVDSLGYVPNQAARSLVTHRTDSMALVVSETANRVYSDDPYFSGVILGVSQELDEANKQLVLMLAGRSAGPSRDRVERYTTGGHVDGVMIFSMHAGDPLPDRLLTKGIPVVCNGVPPTSVPVPYVDVENESGASRAVRHLLAAGRTRVATLAGPQDMSAGIDRLRGYRSAMAAAGVSPRIEIGEFTRKSGVLGMGRLLERFPDLDAVFVASDLMADGALRTLKMAGRRVPDDVAVVGFDDVEFARFTDPPLTTVRQPVLDIGRTLAHQLLRRCGGEDIEPAVVLPTTLIERESA